LDIAKVLEESGKRIDTTFARDAKRIMLQVLIGIIQIEIMPI